MPTDETTCELLCIDLRKAERARAAQPGAEALVAAAAASRALGDPTRVAIAAALHDGGECCVCDLAWVVGRDEKAVSHHVRLLRTAGLARSRRDGRMVLYELTGAGRSALGGVLAATGTAA